MQVPLRRPDKGDGQQAGSTVHGPHVVQLAARGMIETTGRYHCGATRCRVQGDPQHSALCHCEDCRRCAGAPLVKWIAFDVGDVIVTKGEPQIYRSPNHGRRSFCSTCGAGLFYDSAQMLPGIIDVQTATLDDPNFFPPSVHFQTAERIPWMRDAHLLTPPLAVSRHGVSVARGSGNHQALPGAKERCQAKGPAERSTGPRSCIGASRS